MKVIVQAVLLGMLVVIAGTIPRNLCAANLRYYARALGGVADRYVSVEWQAAKGPAALIWKTGADASFRISSSALLAVAAAMVWAYFRLVRAAERDWSGPLPGECHFSGSA